MLTMDWIEDKDGRIAANWYDDEKSEYGCFAESLVPVEQGVDLYALFPELTDEDWAVDEELDVTLLEQPSLALACSR